MKFAEVYGACEGSLKLIGTYQGFLSLVRALWLAEAYQSELSLSNLVEPYEGLSKLIETY